MQMQESADTRGIGAFDQIVRISGRCSGVPAPEEAYWS
jgi:hypothetical protein